MSISNNKPIAKTDITYCTNSNCKYKKDCYRWKGNYSFLYPYYSFCYFSEEYCSKDEYRKGK